MNARTLAPILFACLMASEADDLRVLRNQVEYLNKQGLSEKITRLERSIGTLENKLEELAHQMEQLRQDKSSKAKPEQASKKTESPVSEDDQELYHAALSAIKNNHRAQAEERLNTLIKRHPHSKWISQAHYWLGELYLQKQQHTQAAKAFDCVIQKYPKSPKRVDALLKRAIIATDQGQIQQAKSLLQKITQDYPESSAAHHARAALKKLKVHSAS